MKENIVKSLNSIENKIIMYAKNNVMTLVFIITNLINAIMLRAFTVNNILAIKPVLADLVVLMLISSFACFIKPLKSFRYYMAWSIIFTLVCIINCVYYANYISFASFSLLQTSLELGGYTDALENIVELRHFIFLWQPFTLIFFHVNLRRKGYYEKAKTNESSKIRFLKMIVASFIMLGFFVSMLTAKDLGRLDKQWYRPYIVMEFGIYTYQFNDLYSCVKTKVNTMFGYDEAAKTFREYYAEHQEELSTNEYTNLFKGKNVIVIHGESIQGFTMNVAINNRELTPNLNKLASEGIYFSNFYSQESVGNSSDSEFTLLSSLLPSSSGTVFMNYFNREYVTLPKLLKEQGYYTFSMHGNSGSSWNRDIVHPRLGFDDFYYYTKDYTIDEKIGLGLSDKSFFRQSVDIIKNFDDSKKLFYGTLIMLTNHTPFNDIGEYSDYVVDIIVNKETEETINEERQTTGENNIQELDISQDNNEILDKLAFDDELPSEEVIPFLSGTKLGNYFRSVHYADEAIGELIQELDEAGLLDNTIIVIYGDHDAKLKQSEYKRFYESEYIDQCLIDSSQKINEINDYTYEINRKVPFIIWSKDIIGTKYNQKIDKVMGMIDVMPTLGNMLGVHNDYALGHDIFSLDENVVVFPSGNWITNKIYYNISKNNFYPLMMDMPIGQDYIDKYNKYSEDIIKVSNGIIVYDLIKNTKETY
ncbi:MAG: sulfatase-like hydrolase/transferase [Bacilli bacterium]|nr:sulfatase-like hydrolase/transferase [Bacilli bacterium]